MIRRPRSLWGRVLVYLSATAVGAVALVSLLAAMASQVMTSWGKAYASLHVERVPFADVGLVLGTLPFDPPGRLNYALHLRLAAAVELWRAGKVRYLIVSGNRTGDGYDEPTVMRDVLIQRGIPPDVIYRDFAGLRTVTSIVRARDIYGQRRLVIVSQRDHVDRALFLARHLGVEAWGFYPAGRVPYIFFSSIRAKLVLLYAFWDLVWIRPQANGRPVTIGVDPPE